MLVLRGTFFFSPIVLLQHYFESLAFVIFAYYLTLFQNPLNYLVNHLENKRNILKALVNFPIFPLLSETLYSQQTLHFSTFSLPIVKEM
jgi:hypothetical protein